MEVVKDIDDRSVGGPAPSVRTRKRRHRLSHRNLPLLIMILREGITSYFRPIFREFGLTEQQWRILRTLYADGELMIGDLAEKCVIMGPSLTGILQRMVEGDLVVKRMDPRDTRCFFASLTRLGRSKYEAMVPRIEEEYLRLEADVGKDDIENLYAIADRILNRIGDGVGSKALVGHGIMPVK